MRRLLVASALVAACARRSEPRAIAADPAASALASSPVTAPSAPNAAADAALEAESVVEEKPPMPVPTPKKIAVPEVVKAEEKPIYAEPDDPSDDPVEKGGVVGGVLGPVAPPAKPKAPDAGS